MIMNIKQKKNQNWTKDKIELQLKSPIVWDGRGQIGFGKIGDHRRNLGHVWKIETLLIFSICTPRSQMIGNVYDFEFS